MKKDRYIEVFWIYADFFGSVNLRKSIYLLKPHISLFLSFKEIEHILRTLVMDYIHLLFRFVIKKDSKKHYPADLLIKPCINMEMDPKI